MQSGCAHPRQSVRLMDMDRANEPNQEDINAAWASVAARRAEELESGAVEAMTREEVDDFLDARAAARQLRR